MTESKPRLLGCQVTFVSYFTWKTYASSSPFSHKLWLPNSNPSILPLLHHPRTSLTVFLPQSSLSLLNSLQLKLYGCCLPGLQWCLLISSRFLLKVYLLEVFYKKLLHRIGFPLSCFPLVLACGMAFLKLICIGLLFSFKSLILCFSTWTSTATTLF